MSVVYESITTWRDLEDGHLYHKGDVYPHNNRKVPDGRIAELSGTQNKAGFSLIKALPASVKENPVEKEEPPKRATRSRKKAE